MPLPVGLFRAIAGRYPPTTIEFATLATAKHRHMHCRAVPVVASAAKQTSFFFSGAKAAILMPESP
jgi:hypothetical protein